MPYSPHLLRKTPLRNPQTFYFLRLQCVQTMSMIWRALLLDLCCKLARQWKESLFNPRPAPPAMAPHAARQRAPPAPRCASPSRAAHAARPRGERHGPLSPARTRAARKRLSATRAARAGHARSRPCARQRPRPPARPARPRAPPPLSVVYICGLTPVKNLFRLRLQNFPPA